ncbi:hypothetical protein CK203_107043 [Vitis vinifera]|uniref:DUF4283 domain-containing protein n=1 Tax=Vitis vinifera TaxID=29760 RepID=A0A438EIZ4_VITVI|nr:hypothetical protein CK203_107043 [Vitis vinifera]
MLGGGEDLRSWGTQMAKLWGLKGNLGLAKLEDGKALLEFEMITEAEKALDDGEISVGGFVMRLEKWSQRTGCLMEEEKEREAWVRIVGLPISLWNRDTLSKIGEGCGGFLDIDVKTERMEELQWARIRVRIKDEKIPNMVEIWVENMCYSLTLWWETRPTLRVMSTDEKGKPFVTDGEVECEFQPREGKHVREAEGGSRLKEQTQSTDGTRRLSEAEFLHIEQTKTDLALVEEATRYDNVPFQSDCLISEPPSFPSPFFGRTQVGEYCDLSGLEKERDESENPLQMIIGMEPPLSETIECWDLVEVNKSRTEANGKELGSDQIVPRVNKARGELSWEKSDLAKFSNFLGFSTEGLEKDIMEFLVKIRDQNSDIVGGFGEKFGFWSLEVMETEVGKFSVSCRIRNVEDGMTWIFTGGTSMSSCPSEKGVDREGCLPNAECIDPLPITFLFADGWGDKEGPHPFRFENMWLKVDDFNGLLRGGGKGLREVFGRLEVNKNSALQQLEYWDGVEKSRELWLKEGDRNTGYFHRMANAHRRNNSLDRIMINGELLTEDQEMRGQSSRPGWFTVAFWQDCWDFVKEEVVDLFKEFFEHGSFAKSLNTTFLVLIPKKGGAEDLGTSGQSACLGQILDASLVANEVIDYWSSEDGLWVSLDGLDVVVYFYCQILHINQWGSSWFLFEFKGVAARRPPLSIPFCLGPKEEGGLGIRKIDLLNKALLGKWVWRYAYEKDNLWKTAIGVKYGQEGCGWRTKEVCGPYGVGLWKEIMKEAIGVGRALILRLGRGIEFCFGRISGVKEVGISVWLEISMIGDGSDRRYAESSEGLQDFSEEDSVRWKREGNGVFGPRGPTKFEWLSAGVFRIDAFGWIRFQQKCLFLLGKLRGGRSSLWISFKEGGGSSLIGAFVRLQEENANHILYIVQWLKLFGRLPLPFSEFNGCSQSQL